MTAAGRPRGCSRSPDTGRCRSPVRERIDDLIRPCTFHEAKAKKIRAIARQTVAEHGGNAALRPGDAARLSRASGPKCANLALGIACNLPLIGVDIHVHRVTNRWG